MQPALQLALARALHVAGVVLWIGGVGFVTTVLLPSVRRIAAPAERLALFESIETRFAWQARATTLLVGASGAWMLTLLGAWGRYRMPAFWWLHAMTAIWAVFTLMLFVAEPLWLRRAFLDAAARDPERAFARVERMHRVLLGASLLTVLGAAAGSHGLSWPAAP
jgi:uncharacterized membrane protein